jgi:hypothetical protein
MHRLVDMYDDKDGKEEEMEKEYGSFNDEPPNFKQISEDEFAKSHFFTYHPDFMEHRQIFLKDLPRDMRVVGLFTIYMFYYWDGTGIAIHNDWWGGKVYYFSFAKCDHDYRELSQKEAKSKGHDHWGMCFHVYECRECGFTMSQDSSG